MHVWLGGGAGACWRRRSPPRASQAGSYGRFAERVESTAPLTSLSLLFDELEPGQFALSPDGSAIAFVGKDQRLDAQLFIRRLDGLSASPLPNTVGADQPAFSPDGRWIVFAQAGDLKKISLDGGAPLPLTTLRRASQFDWIHATISSLRS